MQCNSIRSRISGMLLMLVVLSQPSISTVAGPATRVSTGQMVVDGRFPVEGEPWVVAAGSDAVWVTTGLRSVVKLDAVSGDVLATVRLPGQPLDLVLDGGTLWVLTPDGGGTRRVVMPTLPGVTTPGESRVAVAGLHRVDTASGSVVETIPVEGYGGGLAVTDGAVWVGASAWTEDEPGLLLRVDPDTNAIVATIPIDDAFSRVSAVAASDDGVWAMAKGNYAPRPATVALLDPETDAVVQKVTLPSRFWGGTTLAAVPGAVWLMGIDIRGPEPVSILVRVDAATGDVTTQEMEGLNLRLAAGNGHLWLSDCIAATVTPLDPITGDPVGEPVTVGEPAPEGFDPWTQSVDGLSCPGSPAVGNGAIWVAVPGDGMVVRLRQ